MTQQTPPVETPLASQVAVLERRLANAEALLGANKSLAEKLGEAEAQLRDQEILLAEYRDANSKQAEMIRDLTAEREALLSIERAVRLRWDTWSPESFRMWLGDCDMRLRKLDALRSKPSPTREPAPGEIDEHLAALHAEYCRGLECAASLAADQAAMLRRNPPANWPKPSPTGEPNSSIPSDNQPEAPGAGSAALSDGSAGATSATGEAKPAERCTCTGDSFERLLAGAGHGPDCPRWNQPAQNPVAERCDCGHLYTDHLDGAQIGWCGRCPCAGITPEPAQKATRCGVYHDGEHHWTVPSVVDRCVCGAQKTEPAQSPAGDGVTDDARAFNAGTGPVEAFERRLIAALRKVAGFNGDAQQRSWLVWLADELGKSKEGAK